MAATTEISIGGRKVPYPHPSSAAATAVGQGNRRTGTKPEVAVRSLLHRHGVRFRKDHPIRAAGRLVRPDIALTRAKVAVFIDGCFWHACPDHGRQPKANPAYWAPKLAANVERDRRVTAALEAEGWTVLRFWEHEDRVDVAERIEQVWQVRIAPPTAG